MSCAVLNPPRVGEAITCFTDFRDTYPEIGDAILVIVHCEPLNNN